MLNKISQGGPVVICCLDGGVGGGSENYVFVTPLYSTDPFLLSVILFTIHFPRRKYELRSRQFQASFPFLTRELRACARVSCRYDVENGTHSLDWSIPVKTFFPILGF